MTLRTTAALALAAALGAQQPNLALTEIFTTDTVLPGGPTTWNSLGFPSSDGDWVSFIGWGRDVPYTAILKVPASGGPAVVVADDRTPIPGDTGTFFRFWNPSAHDGTIVFSGQRPGLPVSQSWVMTGVYAADPAGRVARVTDLVAGPALYSTNFAVGHAGQVAFKDGDTRGPQALYVIDATGTATIAVTSGGTAPGGGTYFSLGAPSLAGGLMAFDATLGGTAGAYGVYAYDLAARQVRLVANQSTIEPRTGQRFTFVDDPATDGRTAVFLGAVGNPAFGGLAGVYEAAPGAAPITVADTRTPVPGRGSTTFDNFGAASIDRGYVAFVGHVGVASPTLSGIYLRPPGGGVVKVLDTDDSLGGRGIARLSISTQSLRGDDLTMLVDFDGGARAIWVAHVDDFFVAGQPALGVPFSIGIDRPAEAGKPYLAPFALASAPGVPLPDGRVLPLFPDGLFVASLTPGGAVFAGTAGRLDANGRATYRVTVPPIAALRGLVLHTAWLTADIGGGLFAFRRVSGSLGLVVQ